jgi:hypothetical protein
MYIRTILRNFVNKAGCLSYIKHVPFYRVVQKSFNLKHSLVLTGMFKFRLPVSFRTVSQRRELRIEHGGSHFEQFS